MSFSSTGSVKPAHRTLVHGSDSAWSGVPGGSSRFGSHADGVWRMEEASVAGESPDRSKQHESSAESTSGSEGPVPEARNEAGRPRDPRLAVARESAPKARGGVDTATRVLSVREFTKAADGAEEATETAQEPPEEAEAVSDAGADGEAGSADEETAGSGGEDDSDTPDASDTDATDADAGAEDADSEPSDASDAPNGGDKAAGTGDARLRDAVAAWVASADEEPAADTKDADGADEADDASADDATDVSDTDSTAEDAEPEADQADQADQADGASEDKGAEDAVEPAEVGPGSEAEAAPEAKAEAGPEDAAEAEAEAAPEGESGGEAEAADATDDTADATDAPDTDADANAATDSAPGPDPYPDPDESPTAEKDTDGDPKTDPDADADSDQATDTDEADAADKAPASDEPSIDQPTAVFKAPRPSAPAVDQPTTMLKLGDVPKAKDSKPKDPKAKAPEDAEAKAPTPPKAPETDVERTSTFVALKPLDDPSVRKPRPADATTALPRATKPPADETSRVPQLGPERTTQQPLPPKPPLDLLAELTNTPPPPDTPVRTALRRVKIWTPLALLLIVVLAIAQAVRPLPAPELQLTASDSYTFKGDKADMPWPADGQAAVDVQGIGSFGSSGEQKPVPIASVAKVMTAYVILRDHPLKSGADGPKIKIDQTAEDQSKAGQESTVDVTKGDSLSQREALESILIASANNIARLLARWDAGSEKAFVGKMNDAAKDLGMTNTTYTDPSGLNNTTVSTAVDQVKLGKKAMEEPAFREVAAMMSYVDYKGTKHDNWNRLVGSNDVVGIKTGTTTSALGNLVFAAKKDVDGEVHRIVGAVVRQPAGGTDNTILGAALYESDKLIRAAQAALQSATILKKGDVVGYADDGLGGQTPVVATKDVTAVGWSGLTVKLTFAANDLPHTAKAGTQVGSLTVGDGSGSAVKVPVALQKELLEPGFADKLTRVS